MKKRLLYTILSISLLTVMAGAAIATALFIILTNLFFPWLCRLMKCWRESAGTMPSWCICWE